MMSIIKTKLILRKRLNITMLIATSFFLVACGGGVIGDADNYVEISDQTVINLNEIMLDNASVARTVCLMIYESTIGPIVTKGVEVIASKTLLEGGSYKNEKVTLFRESLNNETMFAELHDGACLDEGAPSSSVVISQGSITAVVFTVLHSNLPFIEVTANATIASVNVKKIIASRSSWVVIHRYDDAASNKLGDVVGTKKIDVGHISNVQIDLNYDTLEEGDELLAALYVNKNGSLNFMLEESELMKSTITSKIEVEATSSTIRFNLQTFGSSAYEWSSPSEATKIQNQTSGVGNQIVTLVVGENYEITNPSYNGHPFEFVSASGEVLLSQANAVTGTFEDDSNVNWRDSNGVMTLTLSQALADELTNYRCSVHFIMNGPFEIF